MGAGGSAMAVASADVVLMTDNLQLLPASIKLCQMARQTMIEGFVFAIAVKIVAIVLALTGRLAFWQAIIIDIGSLVVVVINGTKPLYAARWLFKPK
jgi:Cd2+/Zn2+-exporting ATPase